MQPKSESFDKGLSPWIGVGKERGGYLKTAIFCKRLHWAEVRGMSFQPISGDFHWR